MTQILVIDDHPAVRKGLKQVLEAFLSGGTFAEATTGEEAVRAARAGSWDLALLDLSLPDKNGLEVLKELLAVSPDLRVLVLSMHSEELYALRALRAGAAGYVTKMTAAVDLVAGVRTVLAGGRYVSPSLGERLAAEIRDAKSAEPGPAKRGGARKRRARSLPANR
jgi:two-component system, NarL family, invasion response regulator UvrY